MPKKSSSTGPFNIILNIIWEILNINMQELLLVIDYVHYEQVEKCNIEYPGSASQANYRCQSCAKPKKDRINGKLSCQFVYEHCEGIDERKLYKWKSTIIPTQNEMVSLLEKCLFAYIDGVDDKGDRKDLIDSFGYISTIKNNIENRINNSDMNANAKTSLIERLEKAKYDKGAVLDEDKVYKYTRNMIDLQLKHSWNLQRLDL